MQRWLSLTITAAIGITLGLIYGWLVDPVEFVDTTPDSLRGDYRAGYVLMVAEAYRSEQDPALAARRLGVLSSRPPGETASEAIRLARESGFSEADLQLMQALTLAMQAWQPPAPAGTAP
jgi:hypothetical protein